MGLTPRLSQRGWTVATEKEPMQGEDFVIPGDDQKQIRKLLFCHPLRPIPAKVERAYRNLYSMLAHKNKCSFSRDHIACVIASLDIDIIVSGPKGSRRRLVDGKDLSTDPTPKPEPEPKKEEPAQVGA